MVKTLPKPRMFAQFKGTNAWIEWAEALVEALTKEKPKSGVELPVYTVLTLPSAEAANFAIIVSDEAGGRTIATSDGTNWRRVSDGAIVS